MIHVKNLTKYYGDKAALDGVSFSIDAGRVVGLLGLNGAGKSTTMNILTGYISATSGEVAIGGYDIAGSSSKAKCMIGYLPEQPSFYPEMRVDEHLRFICRLKGFGKSAKERNAHIAEICGRVGITDVQSRMIRNLSKGYRQRVGFAQALVGNPRVLILDEPTAGLDPSQIVEIRKLIKDCGKESTVIVSSHILSEIQAMCGRVIVLNEGRVIADDLSERLAGGPNQTLKVRVKGEPERVATALTAVKGMSALKRLPSAEPGSYDYALVCKEGCDIREDIFRALAKADLPMLAAGGFSNSLEDVFLRLTGASPDEKEGRR